MDNFDIPGFILTTRDGSMYELVREDLGWHEINDYGGWEAGGNYTQAYGKATLRQITDPNGNGIKNRRFLHSMTKKIRKIMHISKKTT